ELMRRAHDWPVAMIKRPRHDPFIEHGGDLPLEAGIVSTLPRLGDPLGAHAFLALDCLAPPPLKPRTRPAPATQPRRFDSAGFAQGLVLLPFAVELPSINAERRRARVEGPRTVASVQIGQTLPGGPGGFARQRGGVHVYPGRDKSYAILSVNL